MGDILGREENGTFDKCEGQSIMAQGYSPNQVSVTLATSRIGPTYAVQTAALSIQRLPQRSNRPHQNLDHGCRRKGWRAGTPRVL